MPCYDKKLEASRKDFHNDIYSTRDIDCVITTGELELLMREKGWDLSVPVEGELEPLPQSNSAIEFPELLSHPGTSSGSYLHSIIDMIFLTSSDPLDLSVRAVRSTDYEEYTLKKRESGEVVFKGAKCYGFRNLQNVVRRVGKETGVQAVKGAAPGGLRARMKKRAEARNGEEVQENGYDYVEVMACPGGCVNGGGQLKPPATRKDAEGYERNWKDSGVEMAVDVSGSVEGVMQNAKWGDREWTRAVEKVYWHALPTPPSSPKLSAVDEDPTRKADHLAAQILVDMCHPQLSMVDPAWDTAMDEKAELRRQTLFRTQYKAVESEVIGLAVKW
jgi:iron only hydrogenase large subunit-like protein